MAQVLNTGKQRSGKNSRVTIGATNLRMAEWHANETGQDIDTVNFESGGFDEGITGIFGVELGFSGLWDAGVNPFIDPPGVYPRDDLATVKFYTSTTDGVYWAFPYIRILSANVSAAVRDAVKFEAGGKSQGVYTRPATSV